MRVFFVLIILVVTRFDVSAHDAREDRQGCHADHGDYHCHETEGDAGEFFAFLVTMGIIGYVLCDRVISCGQESGEIPEQTPRPTGD